MNPVQNLISELVIGNSESYGGLTVFPLLFKQRSPLEYLLLSDALSHGLAVVTEVSDSGSVPELRVQNKAEQPVLIIDGEALVGAKQNRVANLTVLLPPEATTIIPVSCVESGRWAHTRPDFEVADHLHFARGRAEKLGGVYAAMRSTGSRRSDQDRIWQSINEKARAMHAGSPTGAMDAIFDRHGETLEDYLSKFEAGAQQVGAVFAIGDKLCGLDVFDKPATYCALQPRLIRSYGIDAVERLHKASAVPSLTNVKELLQHIADSPVEEYPAVGMGFDVSLKANGLVAGGLVVDATLVHLVAFTEPSGQSNAPYTEDLFATGLQRGDWLRRRYH